MSTPHTHHSGSHTKPEPPRIPLYITHKAWTKLCILFRFGYPAEVMAFGISDPEDPLLMTDILIPHQRGGSAHTQIIDEKAPEDFTRLVTAGLQPWQFNRIWIHTHPFGGLNAPHPSGQDTETMKEILGIGDWGVMLIFGVEHSRTLSFPYHARLFTTNHVVSQHPVFDPQDRLFKTTNTEELVTAPSDFLSIELLPPPKELTFDYEAFIAHIKERCNPLPTTTTFSQGIYTPPFAPKKWKTGDDEADHLYTQDDPWAEDGETTIMKAMSDGGSRNLARRKDKRK